MTRLAIAMDLGTSGFRAHAIDLNSREIISTAITTRHPLPGANVIDHLHFALEMSVEIAGNVMMEAVNKVLGRLRVPLDDVVRLAVCGNPIQLSLFQRIEIRDLAFAGKRKLEALGVVPPKRDATVLTASQIRGLMIPAEAEVLIPPAVRHEIGADALAMMIQTGMLERDETSLTTDYGTNAEMALFHQGQVITGSTAAGPALEGQQITCGMLAMPGAISDLNRVDHLHRLIVLDQDMLSIMGPLINLETGNVREAGEIEPVGITGTGTVAIVSQGLEANLVRLPRINTLDAEFHLSSDINFTEEDLKEAGKAIGSVRAGHVTLCHEAGIDMGDVVTAYMSGASGTYVDALKAQRLGMIPPRVKTIYQVGNTSLAMARDLVLDPKKLDMMSDLAKNLRQTHCMFAASKVFEKIYILELSFWTEGMPFSQYQAFLRRYGFPELLTIEGSPEVIRTVRRDIDDLGRLGLVTVPDVGQIVQVQFEECTACFECVASCPEKAIRHLEGSDPPVLILDQSLCNGVACRRCERACPPKGFSLERFFKE
ncbi:methylamine methyltransferase corrinoid protein reductive activase [Desulfomonile tiedjei]|uniref:Putative metal-binding protein n=1 Tax=Desulfomonile tiedjei (strain ATCC 49306 / DSM 6799 / DCB-1) TaxID=706587 RepID=I4C591_DESTA|nr:methylamine methyltransferase corrinoid protein reductive activase [Desulfomonile tiedjei]AFM24732.1 putative metal-binding protein [Desulfomonile tiedjei DSM 6799]